MNRENKVTETCSEDKSFKTECPNCGSIQEPNSEYGDLDVCDDCGDEYNQYFNIINPDEPEYTVCLACGSAWTTGDLISWERDTCGFCGSDQLKYNVPPEEVPT